MSSFHYISEVMNYPKPCCSIFKDMYSPPIRWLTCQSVSFSPHQRHFQHGYVECWRQNSIYYIRVYPVVTMSSIHYISEGMIIPSLVVPYLKTYSPPIRWLTCQSVSIFTTSKVLSTRICKVLATTSSLHQVPGWLWLLHYFLFFYFFCSRDA